MPRIKHQWRFAADAMRQLIFLVDGAGRVTDVNRTLERWDLGEVEGVRGLDLHDVLHKHCSDQGCYLRQFWRLTLPLLVKDGRADCHFWDPLLKRHYEIRTSRSVQQAEVDAEAFFAIVVIDDVTESKASENRPRKVAQILELHVEGETQELGQVEKIQARLFTLLDRTPNFAAMADCTGALFYLNPAGRTLMGLDELEAVSGLTVIGCQAPVARSRLAQEALPVAERDGVWSGDSVLISRGGREIRSQLTLISHRDACAQLHGFTLLGLDMSDWVRTEEALQVTQSEVWRLSAQHLTIQEDERRRIAVDLHDGLGQTLSLVKLSIEEAARSMSTGGAAKAANTLANLGPTMKSALAELRRISMNLRPATLDDLGIKATLAWYFREFEVACPTMNLERDIRVAEADVPDLLKITIFRIVQEATGNVLKHARADRIRLCLQTEGGSLELSIEDNGQGFDPVAARNDHDFSHGLGLQSMKERAELSGGDYEFKSALGQGTSIRVRWPTPPQSSVHIFHQQTPADRQMPERYSHCLACMQRPRKS